MDQVTRPPFLTVLKQIPHPKGDLGHALKASSEGYVGFGEAYFTRIHYGETKGWKRHSRMQLNLIVPVGSVGFSIFNEDTTERAYWEIGENNYFRLTVPPGNWVAFSGVGQGLNLILNVASIEHDSAESLTVDLDRFPLK